MCYLVYGSWSVSFKIVGYSLNEMAVWNLSTFYLTRAIRERVWTDANLSMDIPFCEYQRLRRTLVQLSNSRMRNIFRHLDENLRKYPLQGSVEYHEFVNGCEKGWPNPTECSCFDVVTFSISCERIFRKTGLFSAKYCSANIIDILASSYLLWLKVFVFFSS